MRDLRDLKPAITVTDLWKKYPGTTALAGLSLTIPKGKIFGLLGANGAGKTTLIRILIGSSKPTSGSVMVLDKNPGRTRGELRDQIGYMPQLPALYEDLSVRENIDFFAAAHNLGNAGARIDEVLEFVELVDRRDCIVYTLSGGMKQRASLACAIVHSPQVLLMDEPTAGVDLKLRESFWDRFRDLASSGVTLLISTHQMDEAVHCDELAVLREGKILALDTPAALLERGKAVVHVWRGEQEFEQAVGEYQRNLPEILRTFGLDGSVSRIKVEEQTLEQVVLDLIKGSSDSEGHNA